MSDPAQETPVQPPAPTTGKKKKTFKNVPDYLWREWVRPIGEAVIIALVITTFVFTTVAIQGMSDTPNVLDGERVFVPKYEMWLARAGVMSYKRGDLVVLKPPQDFGRLQPMPIIGNFVPTAQYKAFYIKRIVGVPGDRVRVERGILYINDQRINETHTVPYWKGKQNFDDCSYLANSNYWSFRKDIKVPADRPDQPCADGAPVKQQNFQLSKTQYFVMGDNRSVGGSEDSRVFGPIVRDEIAGRATFVWWPPVRRNETSGALEFNMRFLPRPPAFEALNDNQPQPAMPTVSKP
jgi:signal peptidase I